MKAIGLMQYGDKNVLQEMEMQTHLLGDNDVLIEIYACSWCKSRGLENTRRFTSRRFS